MKVLRLTVYLILVFGISRCTVDPAKKLNVLMIVVDDLRPALSCYGDRYARTPDIQSLADSGVIFTRAYTQQAVCAPSRNTLMTGLRPDALGIYDLKTFFRTKAPDVVTLPQQFMRYGYHAEGMGKIYHLGHGNRDDSLSWSVSHWMPDELIREREPMAAGDTVQLQTHKPKVNGKKIAWYRSPLPENMHFDALTTERAMQRLESLKDTTFFLAVGMGKPHLPFIAPGDYWDLYNPEIFALPDTADPVDCPEFAPSNWSELRKYHDMPGTGLLPAEKAKKLIHGYYACVSLIDAQVGKLVEQLKRLELYDNTIIVLWGDHGYKLGEYGDWCKHTNFEIDTRIPLIIRIPGMQNTGLVNQSIVETVDIYPTLCEAAGLELPPHLQGNSFLSLLRQPELITDDVAFSQYPRTVVEDGRKIKLMGTTMRTTTWRYTRWEKQGTKELVGLELYDHRTSDIEVVNLADQPEYRKILDQLQARFSSEYLKAHPPFVSGTSDE